MTQLPNDAATPRTEHAVLIRRAEVMKMTGILSRSTLYRWIADGAMVAPIKIGPRCSAWDRAAVQAWVDSKLAA
jgi:predicted DNA-binding transcriptional regulator AlpA